MEYGGITALAEGANNPQIAANMRNSFPCPYTAKNAQWFLVIMISKMEIEEKSLNSIAEFVGTSRQNIKKMLISLENKGYVRVLKSEFDAIGSLMAGLEKIVYSLLRYDEKKG